MLTKRLIIPALCLIAAWLLFVPADNSYKLSVKLSDIVDLRLPAFEVEQYTNTHSGFHGDGMMQAVLTFDEGNAAKLEDRIAESDHWQPLPMGENAHRFAYSYATNPIAFPEVESGWWFFYDEQADGEARYSDTEVFSRYSVNAKCAIYDDASDTLYFIELDT